MDGPFHQFDGPRMSHASPMIGRHCQQDIALKHKTESEEKSYVEEVVLIENITLLAKKR